MPVATLPYKYRVKQGKQVFDIPVAASANEPGEQIVDLSKLPWHIFSFRLVNVLKSVPVEIKGWGGIFLSSSGGGESPASLVKFYSAPSLEMRRMDVVTLINNSLTSEAHVLLVYEFIDFL